MTTTKLIANAQELREEYEWLARYGKGQRYEGGIHAHPLSIVHAKRRIREYNKRDVNA